MQLIDTVIKMYNCRDRKKPQTIQM